MTPKSQGEIAERPNGHCPEGCQRLHNVTQAAAIAGVNRRTLYRWMRKRRLHYSIQDYGRVIRHDEIERAKARMQVR